MEDIASRLKQVRGKRSAKNFAALIGCSMQTIYRYEWGERIPDAYFLQEVAEKTGTSIDWLKGDDSNQIPPVESPSRKKISPSAKQYCAELEVRLEKAELKLEAFEAERREVTAENRKLYREKEELHREKEQLLREKEELLRENGTLREKLARLEAGREKQPEEAFPSLLDEQRITPSSSHPCAHK